MAVKKRLEKKEGNEKNKQDEQMTKDREKQPRTSKRGQKEKDLKEIGKD